MLNAEFFVEKITHALSQAYTEGATKMKFYKYRSLDTYSREWTESILINSSLYFAPPKNFNDPFEFLTCFDSTGSRAEFEAYLAMCGAEVLKLIKDYNDEKFFEFLSPIISKNDSLGWPDVMKKMRSENGVLCLSGSYSNINLWSNYGDEHRGVCFEFESRAAQDIFDSTREVQYVDTPPTIRVVKDYIDAEARKTIAPKMVYHKYRGSWDHEKEYRVLIRPPGAHSFSPNCLTAIYLGCRFNLEDSFIDKIRQHSPNVDIVLLETDKSSYELKEKFRCKPDRLLGGSMGRS